MTPCRTRHCPTCNHPQRGHDIFGCYLHDCFCTREPDEAPLPPLPNLTETQLRILRLVGDGYGNPAIGRELGISVNTVKGHLKRIYNQMQVSDRVAAVDVARRHGLIATTDRSNAA